jgi:hypothetical protein
MFDMKYGRRSPKRSPSLRLASILKTTLPDHPLSEDYLSNLSKWQLLGNDQYGNCAAVGWANLRRFISAMLGEKENYPALDDVLKLYKTQNPNFPVDDNGMDMQSLLEYLNKNGGPDGVKLVAFASVDTSNLDEIKAAIHIFGALLLGVEVQSGNQQDFAEGKVWDYHPKQSIEGGHCVLSGGFLGKPNSDIRFITWGSETGMTDDFWNNLVNCPSGEAWVCIWPENLGTKQFVDGIDMNALASYYKNITGRTLPLPSMPTPAPVPEPEPTPIPPPTNKGCTAAILKLFGVGQ